MASKTYTRQELEDVLEKRYVGKLVLFKYPGKESINGIVNSIALDHNGEVILNIMQHTYRISLESFQECIEILR